MATWQTLLFYERDLSLEAPRPRTGIPVDIRVLAGEELRRVRPAFEQAGFNWDEFAPRLAQGDSCVVGLSEGRLVHYRWNTAVAAPIPQLGGTFRPRSGETYAYDAFTTEEARGNNVQAAMSSVGVTWFREKGYRRTVFYVAADNLPGLQIVRKVGARPTATVRRFRFTGLSGSLVTGLGKPASPRIDFGPHATVRRLGPLGLWVREARPA